MQQQHSANTTIKQENNTSQATTIKKSNRGSIVEPFMTVITNLTTTRKDWYPSIDYLGLILMHIVQQEVTNPSLDKKIGGGKVTNVDHIFHQELET